MPVEMEDPDGEEMPARRERFGSPGRSWWRPEGTLGRVLLGLAAFAVLAGVAIGYQAARTLLTRDARFRIAGTDNIQATGLAEVSRAELLPVFGEDIGRNVFFVPLAERRKQLEQIPWVQHATVMRLLPDQIRVDVVERQPVAFVRQGGHIELVDASGVLLSMPAAMMAQHHYSFPVLTGIDPADPLDARKQRVDLYMRLMSELDANGQHFSSQISEIDLTDQEDAKVTMQEQGADIVAHFGEDHFLERYQRYKAHIAEWRQQYPKLAGVDLRYEQQVVLQMAPGAATDEAAAKPAGAIPASAPDTAAPAAVKPAAVVTKTSAAKQAPAVKTTASAKPADKKSEANTKAASAKLGESAKQTGAKTTGAKPGISKSASTKKSATKTTTKAAKAKEHASKTSPERVKKIALEQRKRAEARRAAQQKAKQKPATKPQTPASAGQGQ
ncbi:MAG: FtsQ-type POTRA domain-containing protein [Terracidiphilus sp.]|nr:FtsQ-type POTRA domain-containing protein [Terracidiphilus sp.]